MIEPIRVFIGWEPSETLAWHVLAHSIYQRASVPVSIVPLKLSTLKRDFERERHPLQATEFSFSRFLVPSLCGYTGTAVFLDCDMLCLADIAQLVRQADPFCPVSVVKHDYRPTAETKMLGQVQTTYPMSDRWGNTKNWSSVMVFQNALCKQLTPDYVETAPGLALHQFDWVGRRDIGELDASWNTLVTRKTIYEDWSVDMLHWTEGGPWWPEYKDIAFAHLWRRELNEMGGPHAQGLQPQSGPQTADA